MEYKISLCLSFLRSPHWPCFDVQVQGLSCDGPRLQSMAVFDEISSAEKAQILGAGVQNSCQVQIMSELRGKSNKICVKNNEN